MFVGQFETTTTKTKCLLFVALLIAWMRIVFWRALKTQEDHIANHSTFLVLVNQITKSEMEATCSIGEGIFKRNIEV